MFAAQVTVLVALVMGASDNISVRASSSNAILEQLAHLDRPSPRVAETLKRQELERRWRHDPERALVELENSYRAQPDSDVLFALAELSWLEARRLDRRRRGDPFDHYLDAAEYAFEFLLDPNPILAAGRQPSDPRYRAACNLYNASVDRILRAIAIVEKLRPGKTFRLKGTGRDISLRLVMSKSSWNAADLQELMFAGDFEVVGLASTSRRYGLGVPMIGVRKIDDPGKGENRFFPAETAYPLTAFLTIDRRRGTGNEPRQCAISLVDPVRYPHVGKENAPTIPLESDVTTALAYMWSRSDLNRYRWKGLLRPGDLAERTGLTLLRPYEPDKIPVVMVHGLASTPLAWIPMLNELFRDPLIQKHYQFLLFMYPTGVPIPIAGSMLRQALLDAELAFSPPQAPRPEFSRMVLLGHSMGGVLSHLTAVSSGDRFWALNSDQPFRKIVGPPEVLEEIKKYTFFEPLPFVSRVVFLATPHRGSDYSRRAVGRIGSSLISEPDHYHMLLTRLIKDNPDAFDRRRFRRLPTSIETLEPESPGKGTVLSAILSMRPNPDVTFHSIIGSVRPGPASETTDGIVPYTSSHLAGVASELVVRSDHGVQKDPAAILEVRRILLEHLGIVASKGTATAATAGGASLDR